VVWISVLHVSCRICNDGDKSMYNSMLVVQCYPRRTIRDVRLASFTEQASLSSTVGIFLNVI